MKTVRMDNDRLITSVARFQDDLFRNIKGIRESQSLYDDLALDEGDLAVAFAVEIATKPYSSSPLITRPFDYGTIVSHPFVKANWTGTRFSAGTLYGVWYGAQHLETTVYETVYHWRRFIMDSFPNEDRVIPGERRVCKVACLGVLIDLVGKEEEFPGLVDPSDYSFCQMVGKSFWDMKQQGLLARSARCNGVNIAIFTPDVLSDPRDYCYLTYKWNPAAGGPVTVERNFGEVWMMV